MKSLLLLPFWLASPVAAASAAPASAPPVLVELYYESFCGDCRTYITGQLAKAWEKLGSTGKEKKYISVGARYDKYTRPDIPLVFVGTYLTYISDI